METQHDHWQEKELNDLCTKMQSGMSLDGELLSGFVSFNNIDVQEAGKSLIEEYLRQVGFSGSSSTTLDAATSKLHAYVNPPEHEGSASGTKPLKTLKDATFSSNLGNRLSTDTSELINMNKGNQCGYRKKKSGKVVSLTEAAKGSIVFQQGKLCSCKSRWNKLVGNSLSCDKIVCEQEGEGPCSFCGGLVPREDSTYASLDESVPILSDADAVAEAYAKKLVDYGRNSAALITVIDDESDFYEKSLSNLKTQEMLEMNNPGASKVILPDIQDKISGIEKAMGRVGSESDGYRGAAKTKENDIGQRKLVERSSDKQADIVKGMDKGLNLEVLEARLCPHYRLLRNWTSLKTLSGSSQSTHTEIKGSSSESKLEENSFSPIDGDPILSEFAASLAEELMTTMDEHDLDDKENKQAIGEDTKDTSLNQLNEIGYKTSTAGWFLPRGEHVLLAHNDASCTFYDTTNGERKAEYRPPNGVPPNIWRDCWMIRTPGVDGSSGMSVVAASAGNTMESGFCAWDFYTKDVRAFHIEDGTLASGTVAPLPNNSMYMRNALSTMLGTENKKCWYKPCGPLIISTASSQRVVKIFDIRDGDQVMKWEVPNPVLTMAYSSPLQWRNKDKVVIAEAEETISLWDVSSHNPQARLSFSVSGQKISALHVNSTDAQLDGGARQRVSSSEAEVTDGVFCTADYINILDFRQPGGIGLVIPKFCVGFNVQSITIQSVFCRGDYVYLGCNGVSAGNKQLSQVQQFSVRKQRLIGTYDMPESKAHSYYTAISQVWGNSSLVMAVCGLGLFIFDAMDYALQSVPDDACYTQNVREVIGPDDMYSPSFDYVRSRALLISRDRPAKWRDLW